MTILGIFLKQNEGNEEIGHSQLFLGTSPGGAQGILMNFRISYVNDNHLLCAIFKTLFDQIYYYFFIFVVFCLRSDPIVFRTDSWQC